MDKNFSFGSKVFGNEQMKARLPIEIYNSLRETIDEGKKLELSVANAVASAMKDWALENNATHYCHWFMPMTGSTSEKHDAFITPFGKENITMEFSGKNLIKGEPDASSFPSGGLRATFEARGYTAWDCTSNAFIKDDSLYIPTAFCSYTGEALDKKTPLLRSMDTINNVATEFMHLLGYSDVKSVESSVGPEQEYFLINKKDFLERLDLRFTGRTLLGKFPPKGQEMEDHYFGNLKQRVSDYMKELDAELWKLGVTAKTKHNETAPSQHELAPIYSKANVATDGNYITMELMKKVADKHGFVCLLHEKPFEGINGSGKHNNWSLITDSGINLLEPTKDPKNNIVFLLTIAACIEAVNNYGDLLRMSIASPGNDLRLGAGEAPPSIVSVYLGEYITSIFEDIKNGKITNHCKSTLKSGVKSLPEFTLDTSDRNRTSPFAFTGNKFEFRMVGSAASIAGPNTIINTIVADSLTRINERLRGAKDVRAAALEIVRDIFAQNEQILFNGNNYSVEWQREASRRGLPIIPDSVEALGALVAPKNVTMLVRNNAYSATELTSRHEILLQNYVNTVNIEALTMREMISRQIIPYGEKYISKLAKALKNLRNIDRDSKATTEKLRKVLLLVDDLSSATDDLSDLIKTSKEMSGSLAKARSYRDLVLPQMKKIRSFSDALEELVPSSIWVMPNYADILYY